jgi:uncharacterized membrane protein
MTKQEFLVALEEKLSKYPKQELEERLNFYRESIADRIEEGMSEEEAVAEIGTVEEVAAQIIADIPLSKMIKEKMSRKGKKSGLEWTLLIAGSPVWLALAISFFAVVISIYVSAWAVVVSFWAAFAAFAACGVAAVPALVIYGSMNSLSTGAFLFGCGMASAGLSILFFFPCIWMPKGLAKLTKRIALGLKKQILKKGAEQ